ncbi:glycosyltransferase family 117 protein [Tenacibaculum skagerrakense]|uniref:glycosyltransferase family 117 protein n=1 Tax=Tenacibaculum skagerrakense TaxID=186571 RepID=UPI0014049005|nr:DUF2723 domain-containing protein [Tenacibaculum skagerrakense]
MKRINNIISWTLFCITFLVYVLCIPDSITFWDSPEFIASNYKLQISHPAGAPFYTLLSNVLLGIFFFLKPALVSNLISAFFGALTIPIIYKITFHFSSKLLQEEHVKISITAGIIAALSFAFCNSFWTASTETEVYTFSFFLLTLIVWLGFKWEATSEKTEEIKYILLVFLLLGISVGVHLINIAVIIPLALVFTYKKYGFTLKNIFIALFSGLFLFFFLLNIVFQGIIKLCASIDLWTVNSLGATVNKGALYTLLLLIIGILAVVAITYKKEKAVLHYISLNVLMFIIGCSSFLFPIIRSQVNTPISNSAKTPNELLTYIQAKQFGVDKIPLLRGTAFNAPLDLREPYVNGKPEYKFSKSEKKYVVTNDPLYEVPNYDDRFNLFFPRVFHKSPINQEAYRTWTTIKGTPIQTTINNKEVTISKPKFSENIAFFYNYQANWLYLRYLYHNFIGKQNDLKGTGAIKKGNWISGFNFFDKSYVGDQKFIPQYYKDKNSRNAFYFLPFLMGLWGLFLLRKNKLFFSVSVLLFLTFGIGITLYVNPVPQSLMIRERDYIFAASFIFFSIWIGLSVIGIFNALKFIKKDATKLIVTALIAALASPIQLFAKGLDNQNRSNDTFAYQLAKIYLDSCPEQAILITNGDNITFPLWYLQEVENYRTDIRVINYDQLLLDWYIEKLRLKMNTSEPLKLSLSEKFIAKPHSTDITYNKITNQFFNIKNISVFFENPKNRIKYLEKDLSFFPTEKLILPLNSLPYLTTEKNNISRVLIPKDTLRWEYKKAVYRKNDIAVLDIIAQNIESRPICFTEMGTNVHTVGLDGYLVQKGLVNQLIPVRAIANENPKIVNTSKSYNQLVEKTNFLKLNNKDVKVTDEAISFSKSVLRRNYYFLAQALIEEGKTEKALQTLDFCKTNFPNIQVPYGEFAFALGKLYYRLQKIEDGSTVCKTAIDNIEKELAWMTSFNPPNPIINVRHANYLFKVYSQMIMQIKPLDGKYFEDKSIDLKAIEKRLNEWKKKNWPY